MYLLSQDVKKVGYDGSLLHTPSNSSSTFGSEMSYRLPAAVNTLSTIHHLSEYFPFWIASLNWRGVSASIIFFSLPGSTTYHVSFFCFQTAFSAVPPVVDNGITL